MISTSSSFPILMSVRKSYWSSLNLHATQKLQGMLGLGNFSSLLAEFEPMLPLKLDKYSCKIFIHIKHKLK